MKKGSRTPSTPLQSDEPTENDLYVLRLRNKETLMGEIVTEIPELNNDPYYLYIAYPLKIITKVSDTGTEFRYMKWMPTTDEDVLMIPKEEILTMARPKDSIISGWVESLAIFFPARYEEIVEYNTQTVEEERNQELLDSVSKKDPIQ